MRAMRAVPVRRAEVLNAMIGRLLIVLGTLLILVGVATLYAPWLFQWFGRLPGDIRIERENGVVFIPVTSMILVSVVASLLLHFLFRR